ncbi:ABC transporter related protein [Alkalilimnicola ehrlichii MLHE-1]|uniref:Probable ATP-binding protein YheS n=2 Tax=Alkalilimnicola ehrlichii TaxID=351052 RepID=Q0A5X3_ALKEH|nr:ABC transporter related protein [Alkalilimnicola ehrlichii MLHE-1]
MRIRLGHRPDALAPSAGRIPAMITLKDITLSRGPEELLHQASLTVYPGQRLGLVGPNGCGKSTLFALLQGEIGPDAGEVGIPRDWRIAHVVQETPALASSALDYVLDGHLELRALQARLAEAEAAGDGEAMGQLHARLDAIDGYTAASRAETLLEGLGFDAAGRARPVSDFSGGWRMRLNLARALIQPSDLLLLDEPTNHLDLEAVLWLEQWLCQYPGALLLISHDRDFLDTVVQGIVHFDGRRLVHYTGGYSDFEKRRAERLAQQQAQYEKQQAEIAHLHKFIDRFRAQANKAKAAQSRIKALERMERIAPAHVDAPFEFHFPDPPRAANPLLVLDRVDLGYGGDPVLRRIQLSLRPGERMGLLGPNGAGKSTFIRALAGELKPQAGQITGSQGLAVGYFAQHQLEQLDGQASPLLHLQRLAPKAQEQTLRNFIGGFGFSGDDADRAVAPFSGGEKARLVLALLVWQRPNLLLLDEPTNHLDLEMRHALTVALQEYEGAVVLVSHDRHLLTTTCDEYYLVAEGRVRPLDGDLETYRQWFLEWREAQKAVNGVASAGTGPAPDGDEPRHGSSPAHTAESRKAQRRAQARQREQLRPLRRKAEQLEKALDELSGELADVERALGEPALYEAAGKDRLTELLHRQGVLKARQEALEADWMEALEALEAAEAALG